MYIVVNNAGEVQFRKDDTQNTLIGSVSTKEMCEAVVYIGDLDINDPSGVDAFIPIHDQKGLHVGYIRSMGNVFIITIGEKEYHLHPLRFLLLMSDLITTKQLYISQKLTNMADDVNTVEKEQPKVRCDLCGIPIPDVPEDATYDEMICDACEKKRYGE